MSISTTTHIYIPLLTSVDVAAYDVRRWLLCPLLARFLNPTNTETITQGSMWIMKYIPSLKRNLVTVLWSSCPQKTTWNDHLLNYNVVESAELLFLQYVNEFVPVRVVSFTFNNLLKSLYLVNWAYLQSVMILSIKECNTLSSQCCCHITFAFCCTNLPLSTRTTSGVSHLHMQRQVEAAQRNQIRSYERKKKDIFCSLSMFNLSPAAEHVYYLDQYLSMLIFPFRI